MTRPGTLLTERDCSLLRSLHTMRCLTPQQVERLHFPSLEVTLRRLRRLEGAGFIRRFAAPGLACRPIALTSRGVDVLELSDLAVRSLPKPLFLTHLIELNEFRIALQCSIAARHDIELRAFLSDHDLRDAPSVRGEGQVGAPRHIPDALFVLRRGERVAGFALEIDRGTEVVGRRDRGFGKAVHFYLHALSSGALTLPAQRPGEAAPVHWRVLLVTTSRRRVTNLRATWGAHPIEPPLVRRLVWLADRSMLTAPDILAASWRSLDPSDTEEYVMASERAS